MKIIKTTYNLKKRKTREKLANPFSNASIHSRIKKSGAVDLINNSVWIESNGYFQVKAIDITKMLK